VQIRCALALVGLFPRACGFFFVDDGVVVVDECMERGRMERGARSEE
jgi:hypothetical protein